MLTRRVFLERFGLSAAGLVVVGVPALAQKATTEPAGGVTAPPPAAGPEPGGAVLEPNVFVHVAPDGLVTIVCHRSEMGQGIRSSLPVLLADELGADMARVKVVQADGDEKYGDQNTDGSNSIRGIYEDMRRAAATARTLLVAAAAKRWGVDPKACTAQNHAVTNTKTKKTLGFGELVADAAKLPVPDAKTVALRPSKELKHLGTDLPLLDGPALVTGKAVFGADVKLPGLLVAVIARPPVAGGKIAAVSSDKAQAVPGVKKIVTMPQPQPPYQFQPWGGVAVVAENTWAAIQGRNALQITWDAGVNGGYDSAKFKEDLLKTVEQPGTVARDKGDVDKALASAAKTVDATYYVPHLPHVSMEPPVALAKYDPAGGGTCEVWAPTQNPQAARKEAARVLGIPEERVTVHVTFLGGAFGRKSKADFVSEAAFLSKEVGAPVRVQFTREDDLHNDYVNTVSAQKLTAGLDAGGKVVAWRHRTAFPPIGTLFDPTADRPSAGDLQQGVLDLALGAPNVRAEACAAPAHLRIGWLRSVYNIFHAFAVNTFIDEIAHALGKDPRDVMLDVHGPARKLSLADLGVKEMKNYGASLEKHPVDAGRLRGVIEKVTANAGWKSRKALKGRALGLAAHRSFLTYVGVVASVTQRKDAFWVDEVWVVADAGTIVNADRVRAQMEGAVLNGMNHALYGGVTHKNGAVEQNNFDGVRLVRMGDEPRRIHVEIVKSDAPPGGVGEPGVPPTAPAIGNAIFALTGKRLRELPFATP